jgi:hypothetical protein
MPTLAMKNHESLTFRLTFGKFFRTQPTGPAAFAILLGGSSLNILECGDSLTTILHIDNKPSNSTDRHRWSWEVALRGVRGSLSGCDAIFASIHLRLD